MILNKVLRKGLKDCEKHEPFARDKRVNRANIYGRESSSAEAEQEHMPGGGGEHKVMVPEGT